MSEIVIKAAQRDTMGKTATKNYRREGYIPGEFYSHHDDNIHLLIDQKDFESVLSHAHGLLTLDVKGSKKKLQCILKDLQKHPVRGDILHVDFQGIKKGEKITIDVPLVLKGSAVGIKSGGILEHLIRELEVECLPKDIPNRFEVDITELGIGDSIQVKDLKLENVRILNDPEETIALVDHPRLLKEEEEEEAEIEEEMAEPEVITSRKEEEEEEEE